MADFFSFAYHCKGTAVALRSDDMAQRREIRGWHDGRGLESTRAEECRRGGKEMGHRLRAGAPTVMNPPTVPSRNQTWTKLGLGTTKTTKKSCLACLKGAVRSKVRCDAELQSNEERGKV